MSQKTQNHHRGEPFPREAFEAVCFHAIGLIDQNREYLQMHLADADANTRQALKDVELETARLDRTLGEMMDLLAQNEPAPPPRWLDLCSVVQQLELLKEDVFAQLGVRLAVEYAVERCPVRCDPDAAEQLCFHLLSNALRATAPGGTVTLTLRESGTGWVLLVEDEGCGLPDPEAGRWLENRRRFLGGAGAGLILCRAICETAGWTLTVQDRPGKGVEARVEIPAGPQDAVDHLVELHASGQEAISRFGWQLGRELRLLSAGIKVKK